MILPMKKYCFNTFFILLILLMTNCKPSKDLTQNVKSSIPIAYPSAGDTANAASIFWKDYFQDKYLVQLIDTALHKNWDVLSAYQRMNMAQADLRFSKGTYIPYVRAGVDVAQRKYGLYTMDGAGNISTYIRNGEIVPIHLRDYHPAIYASWEADIWGKLHSKKRAALLRYLASNEGKKWIVTNLVAEVATNYYELIALDYELKILNETIALQENAYELIQIQKETAKANELAVTQFKAQLLHSKSLRVDVSQQIIETENQINFLLSRYSQPIKRDTLLFTQSITTRVSAGIPSDLLKNRPDIRQAELELVASQADVYAAKAAFYPSLTFDGSLGFQAYKLGLLFTTPASYVYGLIGSLAAPVLNRSAIKAAFATANAKQLEALYNYQKTIMNGYKEVYNQITSIKNLETMHDLTSNEVDALIKSIEASTELFRTGRATYLEVVIAQQNALQAKLELVGVRKRQLDATVNLYRALGGGWK